MIGRFINLLMVMLLLTGCSTFRAYDLTSSHQVEVQSYLSNLQSQLPLKHSYRLRILPNSDMKETRGVPAITGTTILLPEDFIRYVFAEYYTDRATILTCVLAHEICHTEYGLPSEPPQVHTQTDIAAIKVMGENHQTVNNYYHSLRVVQRYWSASRSKIGKAGNIAWNVASAASMAYGGPGMFVNWYATDLKVRLKQLRKHYEIDRRQGFRPSTPPELSHP